MNLKIHDAVASAAAHSLESLPRPNVPEIVLIGRSNVGKSTLLNRLLGGRKLARVSATPGRTQAFYFYEVTYSGVGKAPGKTKTLRLVDLPGFGYAKFSKNERERLAEFIVEYITERKNLAAVCLLNDIRRSPEHEELSLRDLLFEHDRRLVVIATKLDKLKRSQQKKALNDLAGGYGLVAEDLAVSGDKVPVSELWNRLALILEK